jgi:heptaprenylglyceryl phosphate synthase
LIVKLGCRDGYELSGPIGVMCEAGVEVFHVNVGESTEGSAGLEAVRELSRSCPFLIAGGGIGSAVEARRVLQAGADAVAIGAAAMDDPDMCGAVLSDLEEKR